MQNFTVRNEREQQPRKKHGCLWTICIYTPVCGYVCMDGLYDGWDVLHSHHQVGGKHGV